ncbi:MAG: ABC transporter permease, partial [Chloroflexi bacterium]|nr:ABC transporter permease [Chloroflexota bacterium]
MKNLKHIWLIAQKDMKLFATDRLAMGFFLLFPFLFIVMFNFILKDVGGEDKRLELHMLTQESEGGLSGEIIGSLETKDESQLAPGDPVIVWEKRDYGSARVAVEDGELKGFIAFPSDFTESVFSGKNARLEVVADPDEDYTRAALNGLAATIANRITSARVAASAAIDLLSEQGDNNARIHQTIERFLTGANAADGEGESFISVAVERVGEVEGQNAADFVLPGYLVMFVFFGAALGAEAIVRERQNNTLERLFAASVRRETILGGIFAGTAIKGLVQIAIFWGAGILIFKVEMGE